MLSIRDLFGAHPVVVCRFSAVTFGITPEIYPGILQHGSSENSENFPMLSSTVSSWIFSGIL